MRSITSKAKYYSPCRGWGASRISKKMEGRSRPTSRATTANNRLRIWLKILERMYLKIPRFP